MPAMFTHVDRLEVSSLSDPDFPSGTAGLAASFLSSPADDASAAVREIDVATTPQFVDRPLRPELAAAATADATTPEVPPSKNPGPVVVEPRVFPPAATPETEAVLAGLTAGDQRALEAIYGAYLATDDPYLETGDLTALAELLDRNEIRLRRSVDRLGRLGLLRLARSEQDGQVVIAESTFEGLEAFCRAFRTEKHPALLERVGRSIAEARVTDGPSLAAAFPRESGLLLTHAVETLARDGWLECYEQFGGPCGCQLGRVSPESTAWAKSNDSLSATTFWTV